MDHTSNHASSALIVWDMQYGVAPRAFNFNEIVANARRLIDGFHASNKPVIYSQHTAIPYEYMTKAHAVALQRRGLDPKSSHFMMENSHEWQIIDELFPEKNDLVLRKHTASFFIGTMLDTLLRAKTVDVIVLTGVSTEAGIEGTARHAAYLGYLPIVVEDAVGSYDREMHDAAMKIMRKMFDVRRTEEVINGLASASSVRLSDV